MGGMGEEWHNEAGEGRRGQITKGLLSYNKEFELSPKCSESH